MIVLVTGGGGFSGPIPSSACWQMVTTCASSRKNFATGRRENLLQVVSDIELVEGDIQSYERVSNAVRGCEIVIHEAAIPFVPRSVQDPRTSSTTNVMGTVTVLLASRDPASSG